MEGAYLCPKRLQCVVLKSIVICLASNAVASGDRNLLVNLGKIKIFAEKNNFPQTFETLRSQAWRLGCL